MELKVRRPADVRRLRRNDFVAGALTKRAFENCNRFLLKLLLNSDSDIWGHFLLEGVLVRGFSIMHRDIAPGSLSMVQASRVQSLWLKSRVGS